MEEQRNPFVEAQLKREVAQTPTAPTMEQVEQLFALNRRMLKGVSIWLDQLIEQDKILQERHKPEMNYVLEARVIFYHKETKDIIAIIDEGFHNGIATSTRQMDWISNRIFRQYYRPELTVDTPIASWLGILVAFNKLHWYELLNIGEIEFEFDIDDQYFFYINDEPDEARYSQ